jgi:hypothetical protein
MNIIPLPILLFLGGTLLCLMLLGLLLKGRTGDNRPTYKLKSRPLLTRNELRFYHQLLNIADGFIVCPQVGFGALLEPDYASNDERRLWALRTFNQWRADFLICDPTDLTVRCIVELDDSSHSNHADRRRDGMTSKVGYHTIRIRTGRSYDFTELRGYLYGLHRITD